MSIKSRYVKLDRVALMVLVIRSGSGVLAGIVEAKVIQNRIDLARKVCVTFVNESLTISEAYDGIFEAISGHLSGSVVSHGDGDGAGRTSC